MPPAATTAIVEENATAPIAGLRSALSVLALAALVALLLSARILKVQPAQVASGP